MADYNSNKLYKALKKIGLKKNDVIFCHSNLGFFGKFKNAKNKNDLCNFFYKQIFKIINDENLCKNLKGLTPDATVSAYCGDLCRKKTLQRDKINNVFHYSLI